ncbi:hypothetical protein [Mesorhizobium neociceri]|uniref:Uncharacterized protein n=1 Tax=Mesorhizobium neociceri TaxID=1307853 RepID=A0A838B6Y7_9HYPH|nr:hypothetical protein [Mesorhizobium neociceri]MBA1141741.1 hypothetical protein [Mesorhizobium neociceri]
MRDKSCVVGSKMHVARIDDPIWLGQEAKRMSKEILRKEHRGPGDTIEAAANRLHIRHHVDASVIIQCWNRPAREMKVSRWMSVFMVYWAEFGAKAETAYEEKRKATNAHPALVRLADFVAGREGEETSGDAG